MIEGFETDNLVLMAEFKVVFLRACMELLDLTFYPMEYSVGNNHFSSNETRDNVLGPKGDFC